MAKYRLLRDGVLVKVRDAGGKLVERRLRLIDFDNPENNELIVCNQWTYKAGQLEKRLDIVLLINGLPVVIGEAKNARAARGHVGRWSQPDSVRIRPHRLNSSTPSRSVRS